MLNQKNEIERALSSEIRLQNPKGTPTVSQQKPPSNLSPRSQIASFFQLKPYKHIKQKIMSVGGLRVLEEVRGLKECI